MATTEVGYFKQDDDGHWYFVPENVVKEFNEAQEKIWATNGWDSVAINDFVERFDKYRMPGSISHIKVSIIRD